jgi:RNA polymerase sigma factor (sigma-70 family)
MLGDSSLIERRIQTLFRMGALGPLCDRQLLDLFTGRDDEVAESAFATLVERHGPMVMGVCRHILHDPEDVADAFQATFLILVRKAGAIHVTDSLGRWLYGVSRRVALQAKAASKRRPVQLRAGLEQAEAQATVAPSDRDRAELLAALDEEIARLPEKYRAAVVLCDLGGVPHEAAARQLRCPVGTIESRLSRGRGLLRTRLVRRGLTPAALGFILAARSRAAGIPSALARTTLRAAIPLTAGKTIPAGLVSASVANLVKGVQRAMIMSRFKFAAGFLIATSVLGAGAGVLVGQERKEAGSAAAVGVDRSLTGTVKPDQRTEPKPGEPAAIAALEERLGVLERRLDELQAAGRARAPGTTPLTDPYARFDPDTIRKIRPRFECLVEKVHVKVGQTVKKGDPLAELFSVELASAKNELLAKTIQANHWKRLHELRQKLVQTGAISQQLWVDTQSEEEKARQEAIVARDRLQLYLLTPAEIDAVKEEDGERKGRFTLRSPSAGQVIELGVAAGDLADPKSMLMVIGRMRP